MASLQIRKLPDDVYEALAERARQERRSLAQQALVELRRASGGGSRARVVAELRSALAARGRRRLGRAPTSLVREDRGR